MSDLPAVAAVFGLPGSPTSWLAHGLRRQVPGVAATVVGPDHTQAALHNIADAVDVGIHVISAKSGVDASFVALWEMLGELGKQRMVAVSDLTANTADVSEVAAIASRVLGEDILPAFLPLLDDDETVVAALDVSTGEQWFAGQPPRPDEGGLWEAVAVEYQLLLDAAEVTDAEVMEAVNRGDIAIAAAIEPTTDTGLAWIAHVCGPRRAHNLATVLPGDDGHAWVAAGAEPIAAGTLTAILGETVRTTAVSGLRRVTDPGLVAQVDPHGVCAATWTHEPQPGSLIVAGGSPMLAKPAWG